MTLIDHKVSRNKLIFDVIRDDAVFQSGNRSWTLAAGADLVDGPLKYLSSDAWTMTRAAVAVCLTVASLIANRFLLLDVLYRQLADNDTQLRGTRQHGLKPGFHYPN